MPQRLEGVYARRLTEGPVAVIDIETTGLSPFSDRVVEISVLRVTPDGRAELTLDTLVRPDRPVAATEIHGITSADVADAPRFADVAPALLAALDDCVVAAYNAYFDMKFLAQELTRANARYAPPYMCLMYLRPLLDLGRCCRLADACAAHGVPHDGAHRALGDAQAAARLWRVYLERTRERGIETFGELAAQRDYKFFRSFAEAPRPPLSLVPPDLARAPRLKPRGASAAAVETRWA